MTTYSQRARDIERRLGKRRLVFFGTRGADASPLLELDQFSNVFSQIAPLDAVSIEEVCLEETKGLRVDLNTYSIDLDASNAVRDLRLAMLETFASPSVIVPYRPSALLTSTWFPRADRVDYFGVFHELQKVLEHKPFVERQLAAAGVPILEWSYYSDDDMVLLREAAESGPLVLRANRSDGGAGVKLINRPSQIAQSWPAHYDGFLAAAPFYKASISLNVNACVFSGGGVSLHAPSLQLIGLDLCTNRRFGYCGNDFAACSALDRRILDQLENLVRTVARWLDRNGYLGAFGVDAMLVDGKIYLVELNPRFQGSSALAAEISRGLDRPDLYLDHIAAFLGLPPPPTLGLWKLARMQEKLAHVICYNRTLYPTRPQEYVWEKDSVDCHLIPAPHISVAPEGILFDAQFPHSVSDDGSSLNEGTESLLRAIIKIVSPLSDSA